MTSPPPTTPLPASIADEAQLEELLSQPPASLVDAIAGLEGDIAVLGVGGKMGPTLARMALRAARAAGSQRNVFGVARFSESGLQQRLDAWGIRTIRANLLDPGQLADLPEAPNVIYLAGMKFGSTGNAAATWAVNTFLPGLVCQRFRNSRFVALSTGNVYGLTSVDRGGSRESDPLQPVGEYAISCLGRERMFEYFSRTYGTPVSLIRLNYAVEPRYGVLVDIAQRICSDQPIDVTMGYVNVIWQGDANAMALQSLAHASSPPAVFNVTGGDVLSIRQIARVLAEKLARPLRIEGTESPDALLSNASATYARLGPPRIALDQTLAWIADWIGRGGATHGKPTKFENRDGKF